MAAVDKGLGGSSFNYDDSRNILKSYLTRNIYHFSAAKSLTEMLEFRNLMYDKKTKEMLSYADFRAQVVERGKTFNDDYLKTECNTAKQSAIMAHKWDTLDTEYLQFTTVGDNRVRPEHAALDGKTYPKDSSFWNRAYPPLSWNCRCTVVPGIARDFKPAQKVADEKTVSSFVKGTIFDNNVGKTRLIFTDGHPYFVNLDTKETKALDYKSYGLPSIEKMQTAIGVTRHEEFATIEEYEAYWKTMTNSKHGISLTDPVGQTVLFPDGELTKKGKPNDNFKQHIANKTEIPARMRLVANIEDIINKPSEIWSVVNPSYKRTPITTHYIKFYQDKVLVVVTLENEAKTMFDLTLDGFATRRGILLYKK